MEDFTGAYLERRNDVTALPVSRAIAIFHLGGIAIECRLKSLLLGYHRINDWKQQSCRIKDSMFNRPIKNPSHDLVKAIELMPDLFMTAKLDARFWLELANIIRPLGSTAPDYISLRYIPQATQPTESWQQSFDYVCGWLDKNEKVIL
ncbi:MAG: hypothetical protein PHU06_09210 [Gallionella sp.]|nr:hypothetical protein [Gallionella sp.]MDD4959202.1 hypothetical protein [Gallionella sp.]